MSPFYYERVTEAERAIHAISPRSKFLAGGTNLIDLMKNGVEKPEVLIDINRVALADIQPLPNGGLRLGALAHNSDTANHPAVRRNYPLLSQAILSGASPQLRNQATNGGNLMQRTRCPYFMDTGFLQCNKRAPGTGCGALNGFNRVHAILGTSEHCIAVHPSDMCVALAALEATVRVQGTSYQRSIAMRDFHRLPGDRPDLDNTLGAQELILSIDLPPSPYAERSHYLKVRDRASYEFALVSVAAAFDLDGGMIKSARIALGGVAHKPWRAVEAETSLIGRYPGPEAFAAAASIAIADAKPRRDNAFKLELAKRAVARALENARGAA